MRPLISIIVPNYNHEHFLKQRLDSIFNQTYTNFEVILLDDFSTDNSQVILKEYAKKPRVSQCVFNQTNSGNTFLQWSKGVHLAKGDFIWIAESDDFSELDFLEVVSKPLINNEEVVLSYCQSYRVNENGDVTGNWKTYTDDLDKFKFEKDFTMNGNKFIEKYLIFKNVIPNASAVLLRRTSLIPLLDVDVWNEFIYCGDWVLYFKQLVNCKMSFISKNLNSFRYHSNSVIANALKNEQRIYIIDVDFQMRAYLLSYLKKNAPNNYSDILRNNNKIITELKYEKGLALYRDNQKLKGLIVIFNIFFFFLKKYKLKKNIILKLKRLIS